jgi:hypothetical protein
MANDFDLKAVEVLSNKNISYNNLGAIVKESLACNGNNVCHNLGPNPKFDVDLDPLWNRRFSFWTVLFDGRSLAEVCCVLRARIWGF